MTGPTSNGIFDWPGQFIRRREKQKKQYLERADPLGGE